MSRAGAPQELWWHELNSGDCTVCEARPSRSADLRPRVLGGDPGRKRAGRAANAGSQVLTYPGTPDASGRYAKTDPR